MLNMNIGVQAQGQVELELDSSLNIWNACLRRYLNRMFGCDRHEWLFDVASRRSSGALSEYTVYLSKARSRKDPISIAQFQ